MLKSVFPITFEPKEFGAGVRARKQSCFEFRGSTAEHRCQADDKFQKVQLGISTPEVREDSWEWEDEK